jgi:predicted ATPase
VRLKALTWNRYRAFKERQRVELAPVTIIIGKNGSGKSVISRLPLLLSSAISDNPEGPLNLMAGGVEHSASFQDLANLRGSLPFSLGFEICGEEGSFGFETTLRYVNETRSLAIEHFVLSEMDRTIFDAEISSEDQLTEAAPTYVLRVESAAHHTAELKFAGLFPRSDGLDGQIGERLDTILGLFRTALPTPSYLGPFRAEPERSMRMPNQTIRELGPRGERALEILADDRLRHGGDLVRQVSEWFAEAMGQEIYVDTAGDQPKVLIADAGSGFQVSLADTGAGFAQSLPVVVQHFAYRVGRIKTPVLIVEQPELHLHPAAHGALADLMIQSSRVGQNWAPATCIVETHSEQFIMRLRRRIGEGLSPDAATIWSLRHRASEDAAAPGEALRVIVFDKTGNPDAWPTGVFEETLSDLTALRRSVRARGL